MLFNANCFDIIDDIISKLDNPIVVTDPPFNIGYHYEGFKDSVPEDEYINKLAFLAKKCPTVYIHYPETLYKIAIRMGEVPCRVVSWVYNSNTGKQHRDIAFFGITPDFKKVRQPYKNPNDKRIKERIARGLTGAKLYDWWNINQVKNVSKDKTDHPCQMPLEVMKNIIGILPQGTIIDPFMGSGTTCLAASELDREYVGIELIEKYFEIAKKRLDK